MILGLVPPSPRLLHFSSRAALSPSDDFHSVLFPALLDLFFPNFLPPTHSPLPTATSRLPSSSFNLICHVSYPLLVNLIYLEGIKTESGEVCDALFLKQKHTPTQTLSGSAVWEVCSCAENNSEKHQTGFNIDKNAELKKQQQNTSSRMVTEWIERYMKCLFPPLIEHSWLGSLAISNGRQTALTPRMDEQKASRLLPNKCQHIKRKCVEQLSEEDVKRH